MSGWQKPKLEPSPIGRGWRRQAPGEGYALAGQGCSSPGQPVSSIGFPKPVPLTRLLTQAPSPHGRGFARLSGA
jgi:hypothetical protein